MLSAIENDNAREVLGQVQAQAVVPARRDVRMTRSKSASSQSSKSDEAELHFEFEQFYPVMGPLGITLSGEVGLKTRFGFGYDTRGIIDYQTGGGNDLGSLLNGFYALAALDEEGIPFTGITLMASIAAGIELNVLVASAGVEGDITATVGFYLNDLVGDEFGLALTDAV